MDDVAREGGFFGGISALTTRVVRGFIVLFTFFLLSLMDYSLVSVWRILPYLGRPLLIPLT